MRPMLATRGDRLFPEPPAGNAWLHEVKWDGVRALVEITARGLVMTSRNENAITAAYPEVHGLADVLPIGTLLDGEVVAFDEGRPSFARLADRMHVRDAARAERLAVHNPVTFMAFDLLRFEDADLTGRSLVDRRARLEELGLDEAGVSVHVAPAYDDGQMLLEATRAQGLEGIVSKHRDSTYRFDHRSKDWLKYPHRARASYVVGGWRPEKGVGDRLGALLVGEPTAEGLLYRGRVGSGIAGKAASRLAELLAPLTDPACPFVDEVPRVDATGARWCRPELVVDIAALGTTGGGRLRQPAYVGPRPDLDPEELKSDEPAEQ